MKSFLVALICIASAFADVSELLLQPVPHHLEDHHIHENAQPLLEHHSEAIHVEKHVTFDLGLGNEGVEIVEAIEVLPVGGHADVQLTEAHSDYQGPYHYEKPKVQLDYVVPAVVPEQPTPVDDGIPLAKNYLPPRHIQDEQVQTKRHVKYIVRRRV